MGNNLAGLEFLIWGALGHALVLERTLADLGARVLGPVDIHFNRMTVAMREMSAL